MATKKNDDVQVIKKKPRGGNSPVIGDNGLQVEPGDNAKFLGVSMSLFKMDKVDLQNVVAVNERLEEYFQLYFSNDMKPTVVGMAMALGISRQQLWSIKTGQPYSGSGAIVNVPPEVANSIKKAYNLMENLWESYMQNGKINPASGIFLGKNNFGYQDKTEYVVTPNVNNDNYNPEDIRSRYLIDSNNSEND